MLAGLHARRGRRDEGYSLVELLVVIIILGILSAIAIPVFLTQRGKGYDAAIKSDLRNAATAQEAYITDHGSYGTTEADLLTEGYKPSSGKEYYNGVESLTVLTDSTNKWYCLTAKSASNVTWTYDSGDGGLLGANQACVSS